MPGFSEYGQQFGPAISSMAAPQPQQGAFAPPTNAPQASGPPAPPQQQPGPGPAQAQEPGLGQSQSFFNIWRAGTEGEREKLVTEFEGNGVDIDTEARVAAINDPEAAERFGLTAGKKVDDLTKQEKAGLLMEFGMRLMQASAGNNAAGAFGEAGMGTMDKAAAMKKAKRDEAKEAAGIKAGAKQQGIENQMEGRKVTADESRAKSSAQSADASTMQAQAAMKKAGPGFEEIVNKNGQAHAIMSDGSTKPLNMPYTPQMSSGAKNKPSATRDKYNLFMESYARSKPNASPQDIQLMEKAALQFAQQTGNDQSVGARETALETVTALVEDDIRGMNLSPEEKIAKIKEMRNEVAKWIMTGEDGEANPYDNL